MPYITREDGERFVIPSYRDTLSAKKEAILKKEILLLSSSYGEYMALQRKNADQYEAAFSPDAGYLLGETVWHYFKRPVDLIYCEAIPNTSEAILVIVKGGTVYLDGNFPVESIPEELVVFRTQQNSFEIYVYGDVPISKEPEPGKFALDGASIKSFAILPEPIFAKLPRVKAFQLRLVDTVLKSYSIGVFPVKKAITALVILGLIWMTYTYYSTHKKEIPTVFVGVINPYQGYIDAMVSPDPANELENLARQISKLYTIPGWIPDVITYSGGTMQAVMKSPGMKTSILFDWANNHQGTVLINSSGLNLILNFFTVTRPAPTTISSTQQIIAEILDRIQSVVPGNNLALGTVASKGKYTQTTIIINYDNLNLTTFALLGEQLKGLPLVLSKVTATADGGVFSGSITLQVLGN